jgi:hypothetical protein
MASDLHYSQVSLLLHCDGTNGSTIFTDNAPTPKAVTAIGNAQISTARSKFGGASALFDGTGDYVSVVNNTDFSFGTGDFTIEFHAYIASTATDQAFITIANPTVSNAGTDLGVGVHYFPSLSNKVRAFIYGAGPTNIVVDSTGAAPTSTWFHVALTVASGQARLFIDGVLQDTVAIGFAPSFDSAHTLRLGTYETGTTRYLDGNIDEVRVTKGYARYTATFTPPTAAYPNSAAEFSGNITESSAITNWRVTAVKCSDGALVGTTTVTGTTYLLGVTTTAPCLITLSPKIDRAWTASTAVALNDYGVAVNPDATPHLWQCTTAGTTGATEPSWNLSGTTTDNTVTWTYVAPLADPKTLGPKIPS